MVDDGGGMNDYPHIKKPETKSKFKFTLNVWYGTSLRIIGLFATAMLVSFTPELFRGFFGDEAYPADDRRSYGHGFIDQNWDWGYRHYLYFLMCFCLFVVQACRLIKWIDKNKENFKP